jgi:CheY-like chemotaxis protein
VVLKVKSKAASDKQTQFAFSVCDTGIGINAEKTEKIFKPFTQADSSTSRDFGGTGLGLTICKQLVELMGGKISLSSIPGEGSTFSFSVPCEIQTCEPQNLVQEYIGKRVLVVNDEATILTVMKKSLNEAGFDVETLSLPNEIVEKLSANNRHGIPFDLVIMANMIKEEDDIAGLKMLCNEPLLAGTPVIILTDFFSNDFSEQLAMEAGVKSILFKPVGMELLLQTIRILLQFDTDTDDDGNDAVEPERNKYPELQGLTILLAEDNSFNQILAKDVLASVGVAVRIANNGREAVEMLDRDIDAILMDIQMPEMDGFEATAIIRSQREFAAVPIIAMTAHAMSGYKQKCIQAGMDDYVSKPFQAKDVFTVLARNITSLPKAECRVGQEQNRYSVDSLTVDSDAVRHHLRDFYKVNGEQLEKMLQSSQKALGKDLAAAEENLVRGDLDSLSRSAHSIKGLLLNLGCNQLATLAERIEKQQIREDDEKESVLQQQLLVLKNELSSFIGLS